MDLRRLAILARGTGHEKAALGVVALRIWRSWPAMAVVACSAVGRGCTRLRRSRINNCLPIIRCAINTFIARRTGTLAPGSGVTQVRITFVMVRIPPVAQPPLGTVDDGVSTQRFCQPHRPPEETHRLF